MAPQGTGGFLGTAGNCWLLQGTSGIYWLLRVLCVLPGTAGTVGYRRVYTGYCRFCVCTAGYCRVPQGIYWLLRVLCVLPGTDGYCWVYILATAGSVCTAGYCWYCGVLWGTAGYILGTAGSVCTAGYCWVLQGTAVYILATAGSVCNAGYCWSVGYFRVYTGY